MSQPAVAELADELIAEGGERALQIAVVRDGETIVDVAAGSLEGEPAGGGSVIDSGTLFPVFSVSKGVTALVAYRAVAQGRLAFDLPVAEVWPEFAANGKSDITVGEILAHASGLARLPDVAGFDEFCSWDTMVRLLADAVPDHRGRVGYHALTYGWLIGETVRRAGGDPRGFGEIMRAELFDTGPGDFWFGIPDEVEPRIATVVREVAPVDDGRPLLSALPLRFATVQEVYGRPDVRRACLPGVNGIGNARSLASLYARAASGALVDPAVLDEGLRPRSAATDSLMGTFVARGLGFYVGVGQDATWAPPFDAGQRTFGHPGAGGSFAWGDRASGTGFAICRSRLTADGWQHENMQRLIRSAGDAAGR